MEWSTGDRKNFDTSCSWWAFNLVNNYANLNWGAMYPVIRERKAAIEKNYFDNQAAVEAEAVRLYESGDEDAARAYLTQYVCDSMDNLNTEWWNFAWELLGHYYDGMRIEEDGSSTTLGYPTEWLEAVDFGGTSATDQAKLSGEAPVEEPDETPDEQPAPSQPAPAEPAPSGTPSEPAVNTESNNSTALIIGLVAAVVVAAGAWFALKKKDGKK